VPAGWEASPKTTNRARKVDAMTGTEFRGIRHGLPASDRSHRPGPRPEGMTQAELAEVLGVSVRLVRYMEAGQSRITRQTERQLSMLQELKR